MNGQRWDTAGLRTGEGLGGGPVGVHGVIPLFYMLEDVCDQTLNTLGV